MLTAIATKLLIYLYIVINVLDVYVYACIPAMHSITLKKIWLSMYVYGIRSIPYEWSIYNIFYSTIEEVRIIYSI